MRKLVGYIVSIVRKLRRGRLQNSCLIRFVDVFWTLIDAEIAKSPKGGEIPVITQQLAFLLYAGGSTLHANWRRARNVAESYI